MSTFAEGIAVSVLPRRLRANFTQDVVAHEAHERTNCQGCLARIRVPNGLAVARRLARTPRPLVVGSSVYVVC